MVTFVSDDRFVTFELLDEHAYVSSITRLESGSFVLVWHSGGDQPVFAEMLDAGGNKIGAPIQVAARGILAEVVALASGGFAVGWVDQGVSVNTRAFSAQGVALGNAEVVAQLGGLPVVELDLSPLDSGGYVAVWQQPGPTLLTQQADVRTLDAGGTPITPRATISNDTRGAAVVTLDDGRTLVAHMTDTAIVVRGYDAVTGTIAETPFISRLLPVGATYSNVALTQLAGGNILLTWQNASSATMLGLVFTSTGALTSDSFGLAVDDRYGADVAALDDGGFVVTYGVGPLKAQIFDASAKLLGPAFDVSPADQGDARGSSVTAFGTNDFAVAWTHGSGVNADASVRLFFNVTNGQPDGGPLIGTAGIDHLRGLGGDDIISGLDGDDVIMPGAGADTMDGGEGNDLFLGTAADFDGDTIVNLAVGDRIRISDATFAGFTFALDGSTLTYSGGSLTLLSLPPDAVLTATAAAGGGVDLQIKGPEPDPLVVANDFNGDGRSDILWRNMADGTVSNWLGQENGGFVGNDANALVTGVPLAWQVAGIGDFDGDGRADLLWRNVVDGTFSNWLGQANGGFVVNDANALTAGVPISWHIIGTGDFDGDGRDDILWRHEDGTLSNWLARADGSFAPNDGNSLTSVPTIWQVEGVGDFDGDGRADLLWRNLDGTVSNWLGQANGGFVVNDANALTAGVPTSWHIVGTGDFDGDGRDDILWRHEDGTLSNWLGQANGGFVVNDAHAMVQISTSWNVVAIADYNGDGKDDLLWRSDDGALSNWLGQANGGFAINDAHAYVEGVPPIWQVQPIEDVLV